MGSWLTRLERGAEDADNLVRLRNFPPKYGVSSLMVEHQIVGLACVDSSSTFLPLSRDCLHVARVLLLKSQILKLERSQFSLAYIYKITNQENGKVYIGKTLRSV